MFSPLCCLLLLAAAPTVAPDERPAAARAAADSVIAGRVTDAATGAPLAGVTVHPADAVAGDPAAGALSGDDGRFALALPAAPPGGRVRLRFARLGYTTRVVEARAGHALDVALVPAARTLEAVTVTALRGDADLPIARTMLDRDAVERRYAGQEVPFLLETTPSVTAYSEAGSYANYSYLRLRGMDQTRVNVTLDGVPLSEPEDQGVFFSNYPDFGNSIGSVQIQRGVGTSQYGTASFAGAINFESTPLAASRRGGEVQLGGGSFGTWRAAAEWSSGLLPNRTAVYARASSMGTDGYRRNSGSRADGGWIAAGWFGDRDVLKVTALTGRTRNEMAWLASSIEELRADPRANPLRESDDYHTTLASVSHARAFGERASLQTTAYHVDFGGDYDVRIDPDLWRFGLDSRLTGLFSTWSGAAGRVAWAVGAHANTYRRDHWAVVHPDLDARLYDNHGRKRETSAFAKGTWALGAVTLFGDVQARRADFTYHPSANSGLEASDIAWTFVNPKAGLRWQLARPLALYASFGATGREPTRADMFAGLDDVDTSTVSDVGALDRVRPERLRDLEAGLEWRGRALSAQLTLFDMRFRHEIAPIGRLTIMGTPLRRNVPRSARRGAELEVAWRAGERLTGTANATLMRGRIDRWVDDASGLTYTDVEPLLTPRVLANAGLAWRATGAVRLTMDARHTGRSYLSNTGNDDFVLPAFTTADVGAEWRVGRLGVMAQVRNAANARAYRGGYTDGATSYYYPQAPRNYVATIKLGF